LYEVLFNLSDAIFKINKGVASLERVNEILDAEITVFDAPNAKSLQSFEKDIVFDRVQFGYYGDAVIKNVSFTIQKGQTVALVGPSGSGKSTLATLLARFYDPQGGEVRMDGTALREYKLKDVRSCIGFVSQDSILFNDTIQNNITLGASDVDTKDVKNAASIANALEFIERIEEGFEYNIGDGGNKLSGGQKQRLAIARAIYKNPPILILDEATSSLDSESERLVQDALEKLMIGRTSIVIAHRLSTIRKADSIIVLDQGVVREQGNHEELMQTDGIYKRLCELQFDQE
jgi:subfamily B ATP-binding cassette protein MsbA